MAFFRQFSPVLLSCLALAVASLPVSAAPLPAPKHPVAQLVEWELTANAEMREGSLRKMAEAILDRAPPESIPEEIRKKHSLSAFRTGTPEMRNELLSSLSLDELKQIAVLPAPLDYFEIPKAQLESFGQKIEHLLPGESGEQAKRFVYFEKDGQTFVRWFLHPLANAQESMLAALIESKTGQRPELKRGGTLFHFTSSRSLIIFDGNYDHAMSVKLSLPTAEGPFKNKAIHLKEFSAWTRLNTYLETLQPGGELPHLKLLQEPLGFGFGNTKGEMQDAFLFRNIDELTKQKRYLLPAFAVLDEKVGREIALRNGSANPAEFWEKNLIEPLAKGMAELRANTGAEHTSPHSQNLMVELDENLRPTGRVVLRDFDFYVESRMFKAMNAGHIVGKTDGLMKEHFTSFHTYGLRNGMTELPSWLTTGEHAGWVEKYFATFRENFARLTGIPRSLLGENIMSQDLGMANVDRQGIAAHNRSGIFTISLNPAEAELGAEYQKWVAKRAGEQAHRRSPTMDGCPGAFAALPIGH